MKSIEHKIAPARCEAGRGVRNHRRTICSVLIFAALINIVGARVTNAQTASSAPRVFLWNPQTLSETKSRLENGETADANLKSAVAALEKDAQKALKIEILPVTSKLALPPSGDKHDYMSQAPYFWKNPNTPNGLPYIRRDGERNPEIKNYPDHDFLDAMTETVTTLALGYYFTGKEIYAARAAEILRLWFVDDATRMNPHLEYAQAIPGVNTGRGIGIIETRSLPRVADSIGLLKNSKSWTATDQKNLEKWFEQYLNWLLTSKNGRDEAAAKNNHGTFYDAQAASFALFVGKKDLAKNILEEAKQKRIVLQIEPNGRQPLELERTKSWDYSVMNLEGLIWLAELGNAAGVDLWNFQTADGRGIRRAVEYLYQFKDREKDWKEKQIEPLKFEKIYPLARKARSIYRDEKFAAMTGPVPAAAARSVLLER